MKDINQEGVHVKRLQISARLIYWYCSKITRRHATGHQFRVFVVKFEHICKIFEFPYVELLFYRFYCVAAVFWCLYKDNKLRLFLLKGDGQNIIEEQFA